MSRSITIFLLGIVCAGGLPAADPGDVELLKELRSWMREHHCREAAADRIRHVKIEATDCEGGEKSKHVVDHLDRHEDGSADRVIKTHVHVKRPDEQPVNRKRTDQIHSEKTEDGRTWTRDTEASDNRGRYLRESATGELHRTGEGTGWAARNCEGTRGNQEKSVTYQGDDHAEWKPNDLEGRDTVINRHRENSEGRYVDQETQRRTKPTEDGVAWKEATSRTTDKDEKQTYKEGRLQRIVTKTGYIDYLIEKGKDDEGNTWTREIRETVIYRDEERLVEHATALRRGSKLHLTIRRGTYSRLPSGKGWKYVGTVEVKLNNKLQEKRDVERTCRYLHIPDEKPEKGDELEEAKQAIQRAKRLEKSGRDKE